MLPGDTHQTSKKSEALWAVVSVVVPLALLALGIWFVSDLGV